MLGKVFVSHTSHDKPFVDQLVSDISARGISVWYDKFDINIGDSVPGRINEGLASAKYFLIVLSPRSVASRWVREELNAALVQQVSHDGTFLLPVLYQECDMPPLLRHRRYADFRSSYDDGLAELLTVWGVDAHISKTLGGKQLFPWPDPNAPDQEFVYLHSTRFDKFFRMSCALSSTANEAIDYIVETLRLPWSKELPQLGMRWSFSYRLAFHGQGLPLSTSLSDAGLRAGDVLQIMINGSYEDLWEKELKKMWDGSKMYEITSAMRRDAELRKLLGERGALTSERVRELANSCFAHV